MWNDEFDDLGALDGVLYNLVNLALAGGQLHRPSDLANMAEPAIHEYHGDFML